jgi:ABC-type glycerol-3-phosphate transport system permease component
MRSQRKKAGLRKALRLMFSYSILILVTVVLMLPVFWLLVTSVKAESEFITWPVRVFPATPQWINYVKAVTWFPFLKHTWNSFFLATTSTVLTVVTSALVGFAFARINVPERDKWFRVVVALLIVPGIVTLIPQFILYARLGLINTYWPWILGGLTASPYFIFMFRQFFAAIPKELEDAAEVDGAGPFRIFWQIFLPNSLPVVATAAIFNFNGVWGDWLGPTLYLTDRNTTLAVKLAQGIRNPLQDSVLIYTVSMAGCAIFILPMVIMFFLGQKYILKGVVTTGLKG